MARKESIYRSAPRQGYLDGCNIEERRRIYARLARGLSALSPKQDKAKVHVAVRCSSPLAHKLDFPTEVELACTRADGVHDIRTCLNDIVKQAPAEGKVCTSPSPLFVDELFGMWEWELWCKPHHEDSSNLILFSSGSIEQFLRTAETGHENIAKLCMEARVAPKQPEHEEHPRKRRKKG